MFSACFSMCRVQMSVLDGYSNIIPNHHFTNGNLIYVVPSKNCIGYNVE